ncbi:peptidoglycan-binding protein [Roseovarius nanhaiticus]|uniref:peptidoglycan-binding protein n=1 Tax=Roseovarius nanhaiticus TaxID=573024 RepID=UPI00248F860B|nr:peptidoglycan-binding protein [Roseovarius nanhaiticus]
MIARKWTAAFAAVFAALASPVLSQSLIESYVAEIGNVDLRNSSGAVLSDPAAILTQDRANVHRFGMQQPGDTIDGLFQSREMRARMPSLVARGGISPAAQAALRSGSAVKLQVQVWGQGTTPSHVTVDVAGLSPASPGDTRLSPTELAQAARGIQSALNARGFDAGPVDGQPGQRTRSAIAAFQNSIGTAPTGTLTRSELVLLTGGAPDPGPSFDCRRAQTPTEIAICANPSLAALDRAVARAWKSSGRPADQSAWLRSRDACRDDAECLTHSMRVRVHALGGTVEPIPSGSQFALSGQPGTNNSGSFLPQSITSNDAPIPAGPRAHFDQSTLVDAPEGLARRLALLAIKRDPSVLDDTDVLDAIRRLQNAESDPADRVFNALNPIEKEDSRAALRTALLQEAETARSVTPEDPIDVTLYLHARPRDFVEGSGLELTGGASQLILSARPYPIGSMVVTLPSEISSPLAIERSEAAAFIDRVAEENTQGNQPRIVIWGRITRIGRDESVEAFAQQPTSRGVPATLEPQRAELHFVAQDSRRRSIMPLEHGSDPVYRWQLGDGGAQVEGGQSALALAQSLGLPLAGEALDVPLPAARGHEAAWGRFTALAWLGQNPDVPREGNGFIGVAQGLLSETDHRSFFGQPRYGRSNIALMVTDARRVSDPFPDEFVRRDAKRVFFERYYNSILSQAPTWPVQVRHSVVLTLGQYDFDKESFPIQGNLSEQQYRVVDLPTDGREAGLASAERFGNLPEEIRIPTDQARALRQMSQDRLVRLVWWADFDYSVDTSDVEQAFGSPRSSAMRTGQGTLRRVGIYAGPNLEWEVMSFPVEEMLIAAPQTTSERPTPVASDLARRVADAKVSDRISIAGHVARLLGEDGFETVASLMPEVQQANEFDAPAITQATIAQLRAGADNPLVIRSGVALDTYDLEKGTFAFRHDALNIRAGHGGLQVTINLVGPTPFEPLEMDQATARFIAEQRSRNIMFLAELTPETAARPQSRAHQVSLLVRPERIVFYTQDENNLPRILGERQFGEANARAEERITRRFDAKEFAGLSERRLQVTSHVADLLAIRDGYTPTDERLPLLLSAAWADRHVDVPGPSLFDVEQPLPDAVWVTRHREMSRSWLEAKAAALGQDFTARIMANADRTCGAFVEAYGHMSQELMAAVPSLREDQNQLAQLLRDREGPIMVPRRYAITHTRPHATDDHCTSAMTALVLEDALHEGRSARGAIATHIDFTLASVESVEGAGRVDGLVLKGDAAGTRIETSDGTLRPLVAAQAKTEPEAPDMSGPVAASGEENVTEADPNQLAAAQAIIQPSTAAPAPKDTAQWPEITVEDDGEAKYDILGIATGQDMEDAAAVLSEFDDIDAEFVTSIAPGETATAAQRALGYQRVYLRRNGTEALTLASWAPDGKVVGIMRRMVLTDGVLPYDRIVAALAEKYGEPDFVTPGEELRGWNAPREHCYVMPFGMHAQQRLVPADGGETRFQHFQGAAHRMGMPDFPESIAGMYEGCGEVLSYMEERHASSGHSGFSVILMDFDRLEQAQIALSPKEPAAEDFEIEF